MKNLTRILISGGISMASFAIATAASAQANTNEVGDIIVTANKREQRLQDVGVAVSVLPQEALQQISKQDISALAKVLPSVQITPPASETTIINIRGVAQNDIAWMEEAPIAFYSDGVYVANSNAIGALMFDLARLETLRGPQGTLFGRNSTGGLVHAFSEKPGDTFSGYGSFTVGNLSTVVAEAAVGGPLSEHLRGRISFLTRQGGGYIKNLQGRDLGAENFYAGRVQLAGDIGETGEFNLKVEHIRNINDTSIGMATFHPAVPDAQYGQGRLLRPGETAVWVGTRPDGSTYPYTTCPDCDARGNPTAANGPLTVSIPNDKANYNRWLTNITLNYTQDFGDLKFASVSNYMQNHDAHVLASPYLTNTSSINNRFWQASQELRLSMDNGPLRWTAGVYGLTLKSSSVSAFDLSSLGFANFDIAYALRTTSLAVFGQAEYDLTDKITVIGGLRYGWDWQEFNFVNHTVDSPDFAFNPTLNPGLAKRHNGEWSGKFELDFRPSENVLLYASVNRGTKAGSYNMSLFFPNQKDPNGQPFNPYPANTIPFGEEILTDYEGGVKLTLLDRRAHLNLAAFHYDYKDYQAYKPNGFSFLVSNVNAKISGVEVDADIRPVEGLYLQAFGSYLDAKALDIALQTAPVTLDQRTANAPKWSFGGMAKYEFALGNGKMALQGNIKYNSSQSFSIYNEPVNREPGYAVADVRASYTWTDPNIEFSVFANNVTDKLYRVYSGDDSAATGNVRNYYAKPRTYGVSVRFAW